MIFLKAAFQSSIAVWVVLSSLTQAHGQVTIFGVSMSTPATQDQPSMVVSGTMSVSAGGVGADGATTYVEKFIESFGALVGSDTTVVEMTTTATVTQLIVESASGFIAADPPFTQTITRSGSASAVLNPGGPFETCVFGNQGAATCVDKINSGPVFTFVGFIVPIYTLGAVASASASVPTATSSAATTTGTSPTTSSSSTTTTTSAPTSGAEGLVPFWRLSAVVSVFVLLLLNL